MIAYLAAPTNLGLRPPVPGAVPGTAKAPEALREAGLVDRLVAVGGRDAGTVLPGRYIDDDATRLSGHVRNEVAMVDHARRLGARIGSILDANDTPVVVGGDCSLLLGIGLALARRGHPGLVHVDGHTDFRNPKNSDECASVAGEDLAAAVGIHWPAIADIDGAGPYFSPSHVVHVGHRDDDDESDHARQVLGLVISARDAIAAGPIDIAQRVHSTTDAYWLQIDVDVLDPTVMPAVDSPDPGGLDANLLDELAPHAMGASITVFDPDLDPDGRHAKLIADIVAIGLRRIATAPGPRRP